MTENLLTKSAFAAVLGVDRAQPTRWAKRGMPVEPNGLVDAVRAAAWVRKNVDDLQRSRRSIGARQMYAGDVARSHKELVFAYTSSDEEAARQAAELLLPLLPPATVRNVVAELLRRMRRGSAECLADEVAPPIGATSWLDTPRFQVIAPEQSDWDELLERLAAGELLKVADV